jgi:hypothetical protein
MSALPSKAGIGRHSRLPTDLSTVLLRTPILHRAADASPLGEPQILALANPLMKSRRLIASAEAQDKASYRLKLALLKGRCT